jgi:hypothetical protein
VLTSTADVGHGLPAIPTGRGPHPCSWRKVFELINFCGLAAGRFWLCFGGAFFSVGISASLQVRRPRGAPKATDQDVLGGLLDPAAVLLLLAATAARR